MYPLGASIPVDRGQGPHLGPGLHFNHYGRELSSSCLLEKITLFLATIKRAEHQEWEYFNSVMTILEIRAEVATPVR